MARERKDRSGNWILEHHGGSLLRLAKIGNFTSWQPAPTVLTFPKRTPDGLLDVWFPNRPTPDPFVIEIESYPQPDTPKQLLDDAAMVVLTRGVLPDILLVNLRPKGNLTVEPDQHVTSAHGLSELRLKVHVVNLWTLSAEELLSANDVGLIPWVPLADYSGAPESLLQTCSERIDKQARPDEKQKLLAATRVMAELRYNDVQLLGLLGGNLMSIEQIYEQSPSVQWFAAKKTRDHSRKFVFHLLDKRFGAVPEDLAVHLRAVDDQARLDELLDLAIDCEDLEAFRTALGKPS